MRELGADALVVCAYGQLLSAEILSMAPHGALNIHASLLPQYRGAAPIHRVILEGEKKTGISIMYMDEGLDTGDVMLMEEIMIPLEMTVGELDERMTALGASLIVQALTLIEAGNAPRTPQRGPWSYAPKVNRADCRLDFTKDAISLYNTIRGCNPFPGAFAYLQGKLVKLYDACYSEKLLPQPPGTLVGLEGDGLLVSAKNGSLLIKTLKPEGKRLMKSKDFWAGLHVKSNLTLE